MSDIHAYNTNLDPNDQKICDTLQQTINTYLKGADSKIWHSHPVWFIDGNPTVGYSKQKRGIRLMFWSGADFEEVDLEPGTGKFKDASVFYEAASDINTNSLRRWLKKSESIRWDYKNLVKHKGELLPFTDSTS